MFVYTKKLTKPVAHINALEQHSHQWNTSS